MRETFVWCFLFVSNAAGDKPEASSLRLFNFSSMRDLKTTSLLCIN